MKTFDDLVEEICRPGLCHQCGGCVSFCTAVNYGALETGPDGFPRYKDRSKCIECGLCYLLCPEVDDLVRETRDRLDWYEPMGPVEDVAVARARDPLLRELATDGGVVTAMLLSLLEDKRIDSAVVSRQEGPFRRKPFLARTRKDVLLAAGAACPGGEPDGGAFSTYSSSAQCIPELEARGLSRAVLVGAPGQILSMRKMETMNVTPSDRIKHYFGLFCSGNFEFGPARRDRLERMGGFSFADVDRVNLKEHMQIRLVSGRLVGIPLDHLDFLVRPACTYCMDYSAELADISFGGLGAPEGWTTVVIRNGKGARLYNRARDTVLEEMEPARMAPLRATARELITHYSKAKRKRGAENRKDLKASSGPGANH